MSSLCKLQIFIVIKFLQRGCFAPSSNEQVPKASVGIPPIPLVSLGRWYQNSEFEEGAKRPLQTFSGVCFASNSVQRSKVRCDEITKVVLLPSHLRPFTFAFRRTFCLRQKAKVNGRKGILKNF
eukprot:TRINITY_DN16857_c0_g1_i4.p1 TRINITY_DN16857_c0_g1~~TRINITY_DN16857_c0_g1_i4.p1  ORF type:complete len:124 (-),score=6.11 TRINITY_DN16857_c0_g1_i4:2-373(-)